MALLDGFVGDDTIKDEYGQTQADRREPLWGGLVKAGLLGIAAGGNLMPSERAKYMAQMGGAISDIPEDMQKRQSAAAQAMLRGQQIAEGKQKVANKAKLAEYAKSPEFQTAMQKLDPSRRMLAQAALDAGDVDAAVKVVQGFDQSEYRAQQLDLSRQRNDISAQTAANAQEKRLADIEARKRELDLREQTEARKAEAHAQAIGGWGNTLEGRMRDALAKGKTDPDFANSDKYKEAWEYFNQENRPVSVGGVTYMLPKRTDLTDYPAPGAKPAPGSPNATSPAAPTEPPKEGEVRKNADGSVTWLNKATNEVFTEWDDGQLRVTRPDGTVIRSEKPKDIPESAQKELAEAKGFKEQMKVATSEFMNQWRAASGTDRLKALGGFNTPLNRAWRNVALLAKGKNLYELGVLNVGDLPQLQKALADPSSVTSAFATEQSVEQDLAAMHQLMDAKIGGTEKALNEGRLRRPKGGGGKRKVKEFRDGKLVEVEVD